MIFQPCQQTSMRVYFQKSLKLKVLLPRFTLQISDLLLAISEAETNGTNLPADCRDDFAKLYNQISFQQIEFTTGGFYTINFNLLAGVENFNNKNLKPF
jgi:hypothetical protein